MCYPDPRLLLHVCLSILHVEWPEILTSDRSARLNAARVKITGALRAFTRLSYPEIAALTGRRHHSTCWAQQRRYLALPQEERDRWIMQVTERLI